MAFKYLHDSRSLECSSFLLAAMPNPFGKMEHKAAARAEQSRTAADQVVEEQRSAEGVLRRTTTRFVNATQTLEWMPTPETSQNDAASASLEVHGDPDLVPPPHHTAAASAWPEDSTGIPIWQPTAQQPVPPPQPPGRPRARTPPPPPTSTPPPPSPPRMRERDQPSASQHSLLAQSTVAAPPPPPDKPPPPPSPPLSQHHHHHQGTRHHHQRQQRQSHHHWLPIPNTSNACEASTIESRMPTHIKRHDRCTRWKAPGQSEHVCGPCLSLGMHGWGQSLTTCDGRAP